MGEVVDTDSCRFQGASARQPQCGSPVQFPAVAQPVRVQAHAARPREDPAVPGHAQGLGPTGGQDQDSQCLVHVVVGVHRHGVWGADHPVAPGGCDDLLGGHRGANCGMGVLDGYGVEAGPEVAEAGEVTVDGLVAGVADRRLEQRVDGDRGVQPPLLLVSGRHDERLAEGLSRRDGGVVVPVELHPELLRPPSAAVRLTTQHRRGLQLAGLDPRRKVVQEVLRGVARPRRQQGGGVACAHPVGNLPARVGVAPQPSDDTDQVQVGQQARGVRVDGRRSEGVLHEVQRRPRHGGVVDSVGDLGSADDDRCSRVQVHPCSVADAGRPALGGGRNPSMSTPLGTPHTAYTVTHGL